MLLKQRVAVCKAFKLEKAHLSGGFCPLEQKCLEVDISTRKVAPHCSRRFAEVCFCAEARGRDVVDVFFPHYICSKLTRIAGRSCT